MHVKVFNISFYCFISLYFVLFYFISYYFILQDGTTALHKAVGKKFFGVVQLLVESGANINVLSKVR